MRLFFFYPPVGSQNRRTNEFTGYHIFPSCLFCWGLPTREKRVGSACPSLFRFSLSSSMVPIESTGAAGVKDVLCDEVQRVGLFPIGPSHGLV